MSVVRKTASYILLVGVYCFTWLVAVLGYMIPRRSWKPTGRIVVTGTFFNPNWYLSHITPLVRSGVGEVILVTDEPQQPIEGVRFACPPKWLAKLISRAGAKTIWMIYAGFRYRPDLYMGYYVAPGACSALIAGRLFGRPSCYQMTAGPVELVGGGFQATGSFSAFLGRPSRLIEAMALAVVRLFDLVVVRGSKAKDFLETQGMKGSVAVITGSVGDSRRLHQNYRNIDLIFVGRLVPTKQVHQFIEAVERASDVLPSVKATVVGDGALMKSLMSQAHHSGLAGKIEFLGKRRDVGAIMARSRVFVLTSQCEGLSIAMAEAMCAGVVPVVADVGELCDLVISGVNGFLVEPDCIDEYATRIVSLLQDRALWKRLSEKAIETALENCETEVISAKWRHCFRSIIGDE